MLTSVRRKYYKLNIVVLLTTILTILDNYLNIGNLKLSEIVNILVKYYDRSAFSDAYLGKNY